MFTETATGLLKAAEIYNKRKEIAELVKRLMIICFKGRAKIAVFGAGGIGKTTLGMLLAGMLDTDKEIKNYIETIGLQKFKVVGGYPAVATVVPGQQARREATWTSQYQELAAGKTFRIINCVSWGYHSSMLEKERHRAYAPGMSDDDFRERYFSDSRAEELEALLALEPHLSAAKDKVKMISLVTKQDLWWKQRYDAKEFYEGSDYQALVQKITDKKGAVNFQHDLISCSLVQQNLRMADGFVLANTAEGYDDALRLANLKIFLEAIERLIGE